MEITLPRKTAMEIEEYASKKNLPAGKKAEMIEKAKAAYAGMMYDPEEPVGIVTAQSLSEPATQMTMRTYHFAGTAGIQVTLGLPRMLEIFDARKEPTTPTMTIYVAKECDTKEKVKRIAENIKEIKVKNVITSFAMDLTESVIHCRLDMKRVKELAIEPGEITANIKIRGATVAVEGTNLVATQKSKDMKTLHKLKTAVLESRIKGIKGISQAIISQNEKGEWVITTLGSNLKKVMVIEGVDANRTTSNNIFEIYEVLGIEATRSAIINQALYTMQEQGLHVDIRYLMLLADIMTRDGSIRSIGRYGISGRKASVLVRAGFEETKKHLVNAAIKGEIDELRGTVENVMVNQIAPIGTGAFDLVGYIPDGKGQEKAEEKEPAKEKPARKEKAEKEEKEAKGKVKVSEKPAKKK